MSVVPMWRRTDRFSANSRPAVNAVRRAIGHRARPARAADLQTGAAPGNAIGLKRMVIRVLLATVAVTAPAVEAQAQAAVPGDYVVRVDTTALPVRIAFGSCSEEDKPQPVLDLVVARRPDLFIYLGDNIYGDSRSMDTIRAKYDRLAAKAEFQRLRAATTVLATWDDHDYGWNDTGRHFPFKAESKQIFLDFWGEPEDSDRRRREGIYTAHLFEQNGKRLQIILLDTRTFRDNLVRSDDVAPHKNDYQPNPAPDSTILGAAQWQWLEAQLRVPADLRIIASSIQFSHEYNGWESWTNVPPERQRMIELIRTTGAEGVLFISGDVHWGEISRQDVPGLYPLWDVTSSGITETWPSVEPNSNRAGDVVRENNFGEIEVDWTGEEPRIALRLFDVTGALRNEVRLEKQAISR